jgi:hypothetical protein
MSENGQDYDVQITDLLRTAARMHKQGHNIRGLITAIDATIARKQQAQSGPPLRGGRQIHIVR